MNPKSYLRKMGCYFATVCFCIAIPAQADTTPFTFDVIYDAFVSSPPTPDHLTVESTATGSGTYSPFRQCELLGDRIRHVWNLAFRRPISFSRGPYFLGFLQWWGGHVHRYRCSQT